MRITIDINERNAAWEDCPDDCVEKISEGLDQVLYVHARQKNEVDPITVRDINGNTFATITLDEG